jgi:apolipoprotein N-acyltransferase
MVSRRPSGRFGADRAWCALMVVAGAAQTPGFEHTQWMGLPFVLALSLLIFRLNHATPRVAAWLGWCWGFGWLAAGVWWLFVSMHRYGGLPAPLAIAAVGLLSAALSLYLALACAVYARWRSGKPAFDALLFACIWLLAELARGLLFTGFPWLASGYAFIDSPLAGLAPWCGVYGMGAVAAGLLAWVLATPRSRQRLGIRPAKQRGWFRALVVVALVLAVEQWGQRDFTRSTGTLSVSLLQTAVAQDEKFAPQQMPQTLQWLGDNLQAAKGELVVAPETALPLLPYQLEDLSPGSRAALERHFQQQGRHALIGLPLGDYETGYTNSVAGIGASGPYRYDKYHLVPFGEFIPPGFRWFTNLMNIPLGDFARGRLDAPSFIVRGQRLAPNICYEDLFGEELAVRFRDEQQAPTMLVNLSNIGWFGDTSALPQHLNISRMRSLELQRPMLRSTNTGMTAIIDHQGRVTAQLAPLKAARVIRPLPGGRAFGACGLWRLARSFCLRCWRWPVRRVPGLGSSDNVRTLRRLTAAMVTRTALMA